MESKAKLFGHPIHPILIVIPLGSFTLSIIFDLLYFATANPALATVSFYNIAAGVLGGLVAAVFGVIDFLAIPGQTRAKSIGTWHLFGNVLMLMFFSLSWLIRANATEGQPPVIAFAFSVVAILMGVVTSWLGGELVNRLGVGIDEGANLNAPSSLFGSPMSSPSQNGMVQMPVTGEEKLEDEP
jgi:uncharacterized membrane protein